MSLKTVVLVITDRERSVCVCVYSLRQSTYFHLFRPSSLSDVISYPRTVGATLSAFFFHHSIAHTTTHYYCVYMLSCCVCWLLRVETQETVDHRRQHYPASQARVRESAILCTYFYYLFGWLTQNAMLARAHAFV